MKKILMILLIIIVILLISLGYVYISATRIPANNADAIDRVTLDHLKKIVVCMGDSITHATVSYDYVKQLSNDPDLSNFIFVNEGINGRLVYQCVESSERTVKLNPDYVFILIGTNDVKASLSDDEYKHYNSIWSLKTQPTQEWFYKNLQTLVDILKTKTKAMIVLISIPPLGENPSSIPFKRAMSYSKIIKNIAVKKAVAYIPLNEILSEQIIKHGNKDIEPYRYNEWFMYSAILQHYLLFKDWDTISNERGLMFTPDNIHLNERAGKILAQNIKNHLLHK